MAFSKRTIRREIVLRFDDGGAFQTAFQRAERQLLEDGEIVAERDMEPQFLTLVQAKALVASL
jgi:hypothetical protein